ncbi:MAG: hypothetical protein ACWGN1_00470, partial [Desulfobulbales bacterium]
MAEDIFTAVEGQRISRYVAAAFSGLWRDTAKIRADLAAARPIKHDSPVKSKVVELLVQHTIAPQAAPGPDQTLKPFFRQILIQFTKPAATPADSAAKTAAIYKVLHHLPKTYVRVLPVFYAGSLNPGAARQGMRRRRAVAKEEFIKTL